MKAKAKPRVQIQAVRSALRRRCERGSQSRASSFTIFLLQNDCLICHVNRIIEADYVTPSAAVNSFQLYNSFCKPVFKVFFNFILLFLIPTCVAQTLGKVQRVQKRHFDIDALAPPPPGLCSFWRAFSVKRCRFFHSQKLRRTQVEKQTHRSNQRRSQAESCLSPHQTGAASFISPSQFDSQYSHCSHR